MTIATDYERLIEASALLTPARFPDELSTSDVERYVMTNRAVLDGVRAAIACRCAVPLAYNGDWWEQHGEGFAPLRNAARALAIEARYYLDRGDGARLVDTTLCILDLANNVRRGGLIVNALVAMAVGGIAEDCVRRDRRRLSASEVKRLANGMLQRDADREPFQEIVARDERWEAVVHPGGETVDFEADWPDCRDSGWDEETEQALKETLQAFADLPKNTLGEIRVQIENKSIAMLRLLGIECAVIAHHAEKHNYPQRLEDLAPEYVVSVPADPFSGAAFKYRKTGNGFVLYSVGPAGKDCQGTIGGWLSVQAGEADLFVDVHDYDSV